MEHSDDNHSDAMSFGAYRLLPRLRHLLRSGQPVDLGDRAYELLLALVASGGQVVSKDELMQRAWPGHTVGENALQAQITALRRALGPDRTLIVTVSGRGYQFVAPVRSAPHMLRRDSPLPALPQRMHSLVGRDAELELLTAMLRRERLVTVLGAGGIGKTQLALELARRMAAEFSDRIMLIVLSEVTSAAEARAALSGVGDELGLLVLDGCESWIDLAAQEVESALRGRPSLRVLATSREALRAEGECTYRLGALALPADPADSADATESAEAGLAPPALQVFLQHYAASGGEGSNDTAFVRAASAICCATDGIPLAIEMAAAHAAGMGIEWVAANADSALAWLNRGLRTAPPRLRSMRASLDWSFSTLSPPDRWALKRASEFSDAFSLEQACTLLAQDKIAGIDVLDRLSSLVDKSLVERVGSTAAPGYRVFQLTRAHARQMPWLPA
jgi:predicted ATPase/DNA-binding winged helix-turn-helix (wHTH) protein